MNKDNVCSNVQQTLLDALKEGDMNTSDKVSTIRKKTRDRKKEIAEERRNKALVGMSAFGTLAGSAVAGSTTNTSSSPASAEQRSTSMIASMFGLSAFSSSVASSQRKTHSPAKDSTPEEKIKPSWMAEVRYKLFSHSICVLMVISPHIIPMLTDGSDGRRIRFDLCCLPGRQNSSTNRVTWAICLHEESHDSL